MINDISSESLALGGHIVGSQHVIHVLHFLKVDGLDLETRKHLSRRLYGVYKLDLIKAMPWRLERQVCSVDTVGFSM